MSPQAATVDRPRKTRVIAGRRDGRLNGSIQILLGHVIQRPPASTSRWWSHLVRRAVAARRRVVQSAWRASYQGWEVGPVTLGHMRSQGCRDLLVYCNSGRCNQSTIMNVGHLPDDTRINSLGDGIVCMRCGHLGAEVVPNWPTHASPRSS